jgi:hypothetical protein
MDTRSINQIAPGAKPEGANARKDPLWVIQRVKRLTGCYFFLAANVFVFLSRVSRPLLTNCFNARPGPYFQRSAFPTPDMVRPGCFFTPLYTLSSSLSALSVVFVACVLFVFMSVLFSWGAQTGNSGRQNTFLFLRFEVLLNKISVVN